MADEVRSRFGVVPGFFRPSPGFEQTVAGLWSFAKAAYLDNPLPWLFKERLFVHLSRFCEVRYCIVRHACFLAGSGNPAGDRTAAVESADDILRLLRRPVPDSAALEASMRRLETAPPPAVPSEPGTEFEADLLDILTAVFLDVHQSGRARGAVLAAMGPEAAEHALTLLAFIRTAHYWTELHPELGQEPDVAEFLSEHPELARELHDPSDAVAVNPRLAYQRVVDVLTTTEKRYRWLFESMEAGYALLEPAAGSTGAEDFRIIVVNPAHARLTGCAPVAGGSARDLLPIGGEKLEACLSLVCATGLPQQFEVRLPSVNRWFDVYLSRVGGADGNAVAVVFRDISERVSAAAEQQQRERAQRDFVANAAHELRTPLAAMIAAVDTLHVGAIDDPLARQRFLGHVRSEADRLARLCDSLLLLAEVDSHPRPDVTSFLVRPMLEEIAAALTPAPGVTVVVESAELLVADTNRGLVERVLTNLAENSAKYTADGRIVLAAAETADGVTIEVHDTGKGLGLLTATQAVQRFSRGGGRSPQGFGLGLAIAQQAALVLGAELLLTGGPHGGTVARLVLPSPPAE